jgi:signal transduction histidine kinase
MINLPIRLRLTFQYMTLFASAAALLCLASFWMLQRSLYATEYHDLEERAEDVQLILKHDDPAHSLDQLRADFATFYTFKDDGKYLQVRDENGNWLFRSKRMVARDPSFPTPDRIPPNGILDEFQFNDDRVRVLSYTVKVRGKGYAVQTGLALERSSALLSSYRRNMLLLAPAMILLAALGGHLMSRRALSPVAALAEKARRITEGNLETRLPEPPANDEISDLSRTLNQMLQRIDKAFSSVRAFTGNASHELRTPIALMRTEIEVALYRPRNTEEYRAILNRLHEGTLRMTSLLESLLSLARADGGAEAISISAISVSHLMSQIGETWRSPMTKLALDFRVERPDGDPMVLGEPQGIARLLSILLDNASKYTPPGGAVELLAVIDGPRIVISVKDTGIGISPEDQVRVFDRFYRVPRVGDGGALSGSGLGLALAKWIAERHGTELTVTSELGNGSCFSFSLQVEPPVHADDLRRADIRCNFQPSK